MFQRILVPLDGSERAERALPFAVRIARATQGSLLFVRVIHPPRSVGVYGAEPDVAVPSTSFEKHLADASGYLQTVVQTYSHELKGLPVTADIEPGDIAPAIFTAARLEHVDLIVMAHHGEIGLAHWILRSVTTQQTVRRSPVPVLVLSEPATIPLPPDTQRVWRALVPLDGSERAECAISPAASLIAALAAPGRAELRLLSVVNSHAIVGNGAPAAYPYREMPEQVRKGAALYLERVVQRIQHGPLAKLSLRVSASAVISSDVPGMILQQTHRGPGYDFIAMAIHGRSGVQRLLLGSVTEQLLDTTMLPMLVVRPSADIPEEASALAESVLS
jgi:nucleotide-binding universal stress UspA family protein